MPTISSSFLGTFPVVQIDSCFAILVPTNACDNNDIFLVSKYLANVFFSIRMITMIATKTSSLTVQEISLPNGNNVRLDWNTKDKRLRRMRA